MDIKLFLYVVQMLKHGFYFLHTTISLQLTCINNIEFD